MGTKREILNPIELEEPDEDEYLSCEGEIESEFDDTKSS